MERTKDTDNNTMPWAWVRKVREMVGNNTDWKGQQQNLPAQVLPWLFISDEINALDKDKIKSLGITHVLSLNGVPSFSARHASLQYSTWGVSHKRISAEDSLHYDLIGMHWDECHEFLKNLKETDGSKAIVHCAAGINRSGLVTCAAHLIMERTPLLEVVERCIKVKQGPLLWNTSFQEQLCLLAAEHDLLGEKPEGFSDDPIQKDKIPPPPKSALDRLT